MPHRPPPRPPHKRVHLGIGEDHAVRDAARVLRGERLQRPGLEAFAAFDGVFSTGRHLDLHQEPAVIAGADDEVRSVVADAAVGIAVGEHEVRLGRVRDGSGEVHLLHIFYGQVQEAKDFVEEIGFRPRVEVLGDVVEAVVTPVLRDSLRAEDEV